MNTKQRRHSRSGHELTDAKLAILFMSTLALFAIGIIAYVLVA